MTPREPCYSETLDLIDFAQSDGREAILLYDETFYVELVAVDMWLVCKAAKESRADSVRQLLVERIRKAKGADK